MNSDLSDGSTCENCVCWCVNVCYATDQVRHGTGHRRVTGVEPAAARSSADSGVTDCQPITINQTHRCQPITQVRQTVSQSEQLDASDSNCQPTMVARHTGASNCQPITADSGVTGCQPITAADTWVHQTVSQSQQT